jgi:hypothetical protein
MQWIPWSMVGILAGAARSAAVGIGLNILQSIALGAGLGIAYGLATGIGVSIAGSTQESQGIQDRRGDILASIISNIVGSAVTGGIAWAITKDPATGISIGSAMGPASILSFFVGYYRLPLYPISSLSSLQAYLASRHDPAQVFTHLRRSALYWDASALLPLPGLKQTLLIAAEQDTQQTQKEIDFILTARPGQIRATQAAWLKITMYTLKQRTSLRDIAQAAEQLAKVLPPREARLIPPRWSRCFEHLKSASYEAGHYLSPVGWQERRKALNQMVSSLDHIDPHTTFKDAQLTAQLGEVVNQWRAIADQEREKLDQFPEIFGQIDMPYVAGPILEAGASVFVGRDDLVQQLQLALSRGRQRPTFLLYGERRMGKSSTLEQLPRRLDARYIPIKWDVQDPGLASSTVTFLGAIAEGIARAMRERHMSLNVLEETALKAAGQENEREVYRTLNRWLAEIQLALEQEDRTLLLVFDEFEKLQEAGQDGSFHLSLLLDWFRSTIQHSSRLALLFSGLHTLDEMGPHWAGYFVNVQTLKVSFLRPEEARRLITKPLPDFPGEKLFQERIVEEIMKLTGCHPFLVQAICSALYEHLKADRREKARLRDVASAREQVLRRWRNYFQNLWERTTPEQRACLAALRTPGTGRLDQIARQSKLEEKMALRALQDLIKRDLVIHDQETYRIAIPIFSEWVERNTI